MDDVFSFGTWLRRRRKTLDLTQVELARRVGCSLQMIKKLEADERRPSPQMAVRLAECLEVAEGERPLFLRVAAGDSGAFRLEPPGGGPLPSFVLPSPKSDTPSPLSRLAVFAGSWTAAAARAVAKIEDLDVCERAGQVLRLPEGVGETRFVLPEGVRETALDALRANGTEDAAREAHARFYLKLVERAQTQRNSLERQRWLHELAQDAPNLEAALTWALDRRPAWALRFCAALGPLWARRGAQTNGTAQLAAALERAEPGQGREHAAAFAWLGRLYFHRSELAAARACYAKSLDAYRALDDQEGAAWVLRELGRAQVEPDAARANLRASEQLCRALGDDVGAAAALDELGGLERWQGNYQLAQQLHEQSLALFRAAGDLSGAVVALYMLGLACAAQGDTERARAAFTEGAVLARALGERLNLAWCTLNLGMVESDSGALELAERRLAEAEEMHRTLGDQSGVAWARFNRGQAAMRRGHTAAAATHLAAAHAIFAEIGDPWGRAWSLAHLGDATRALGDFTAARRHLGESADLLRQQGSAGGIPRLVESCARLMRDERRLADAVRLFAAAAVLMATAGERRRPADLPAYHADIRGLHAALGDAVFAVAWTEGERLTGDDALGAAVAVLGAGFGVGEHEVRPYGGDGGVGQ
jgi:tetratricopeptide (TPR) repeat protein/DNA-binding XRE family transcriptional regulator